jgi:threonylcarbamoyladenosine tRNA methylthiotransferase MtaB
LTLIEDAGLEYVHVFPFSPRAGTPAARMPQLDRTLVKARAERLRMAGEAATKRFLDGIVGRAEEGIVESGGRVRLANFAPVRLRAATGQVGRPALVRVVAREGLELVGEGIAA